MMPVVKKLIDVSAKAGRCKRPRFDFWIRKVPGRGQSNLLQYTCLENAMDRGAWQAIVHRAAQSQTGLKQLNTGHQKTLNASSNA